MAAKFWLDGSRFHMRARLALILTGIWTLIVIVGCVGIIMHIANGPQSQQEERASQAGAGFGVVAAMGYAGIWIPWAIAFGKKRQARPDRPKRRPADVRGHRPPKR
jgi:hypothetical protein